MSTNKFNKDIWHEEIDLQLIQFSGRRMLDRVQLYPGLSFFMTDSHLSRYHTLLCDFPIATTTPINNVNWDTHHSNNSAKLNKIVFRHIIWYTDRLSSYQKSKEINYIPNKIAEIIHLHTDCHNITNNVIFIYPVF